jgi:hypothetical protein
VVFDVRWCGQWKTIAREEHTRFRPVIPFAEVILVDFKAGGSTESQREFLEAMSADDSRRTQDRQGSKQPPIANNFALGYTYHDVLDADHEGMNTLYGALLPNCTDRQ